MKADSLAEITTLITRLKRAQALGEFNALFRAGAPPSPALAGPYPGVLIAVEIAPGLSILGNWFLRQGVPWQGKGFDLSNSSGINRFARRSLPLARLVWPLYRGYRDIGPESYQAFSFRTYIAAGLSDPGLQVLKIDYDLPENPAFSVRRLLDELVQIGENLYLGKGHFKWWWGKWQTIVYFALEGGSALETGPRA